MEIPIIYETKSLLVIDKPPGIVVNTSESAKSETVQEWAEKKLETELNRLGPIDKAAAEEKEFYNRSGIVHRLDKETSGLLIIAKNPSSFRHLQRQFKDRLVVKKYLALVHGLLPREGEIKASVGRLPWNRERFGVLAGGRDAWTTYKLVTKYQSEGGEKYSLVEVSPHTGRTHQIRIHFKYIGYPLVADKFYAGRKIYKKDLLLSKRLFLHAFYIKFQNPDNLKDMEFKSDIPEDLKEVLKSLKKMDQ